MKILGLTGSIGMGKSEVARMFRDLGVPVFDADAVVHELYAKGGAAVKPIEAAFTGVTIHGAIDRQLLSGRVINNPPALHLLESIIHPLVAEARQEFLMQAIRDGADLVVLDIPLLLEGDIHREVDHVLVVSAPPDVQRARVLSRPNMNAEKFEAILRKQMPDADKRARADFIIPTGGSLEETRAAVEDLVRQLCSN